MMQQTPTPDLRIGRLICGALMAGVLIFWSVAILLTDAGRNPLSQEFPVDPLLLTAVALLAGLGALAVALRFRSRALAAILKNYRRYGESPSSQNLANLQTNLIIAWALVEGIALVLGVLFLIAGVDSLVIIAAVVFVAGFTATFPRADWYREAKQGSGMAS